MPHDPHPEPMMEAIAVWLAEYGPWGLVIILLIGAVTSIWSGKLIPKSWSDRWLDDKDKIIDRSLDAFDKLSDAVEKNTDTIERTSVEQAKTINHALESIQQRARRDGDT